VICIATAQQLIRAQLLPPDLQVMFALFCTIGGTWFWYCWNNKQYAHRIHILMGVLCLFKALTVMSQVCAAATRSWHCSRGRQRWHA
jgi:hypothetical protein